MVRANGHVGHRARKVLPYPQLAAPVEGFDELRAVPPLTCDVIQGARAREILAARQPRRRAVRWTVKYIFTRAARDHPAFVEHHQVTAQTIDLLEVVAYQQRHALISSQRLAQLPLELAAQVRIQRGEWLIEQQRCRLWRQRPGECHALLLAAGKCAGILPLKPRQMHLRHLARCALRGLFRGDTGKVPKSKRDISFDGQVRKKRIVLKKQSHAARPAG